MGCRIDGWCIRQNCSEEQIAKCLAYKKELAVELLNHRRIIFEKQTGDDSK